MNKILNIIFAFGILVNINASDKNIIIVGKLADAMTFDSAKATSSNSIQITMLLYGKLFDYDDKGNIKNEIAESYSFSKDGKTMIIHLKKGLKFNKTSYWKVDDDLTAEDIVFSFKRQYDKNSKFYKRDSKFTYIKSTGILKTLEDVVAVDKYTVKFKLKKKSAIFIHLLTGFTSYIHSKDYAESMYAENKYVSDYATHPIGSGSYYFIEHTKDQYTKLKKSNTSLIQAKTENLVFKVITNPSVMVASLQAGEIDITDDIPTESIKALKSNQDLKIYNTPSAQVLALTFNTQKFKPTKNKLVRQALAYAINQDDLLKVFNGAAGKAENLYPDSLIGWVKVKEYKQDIKKAKELLKKAGYPNGFTMQIMYANSKPGQKQVVEIVQNEFAKIGVKVKLVTYDWGTCLDKYDYLTYGGATTLGWSADYKDPHTFLYPLLHSDKTPSMNTAGYKNHKLDKLLDKAKSELDNKKRIKLYEKANKLIREEMPMYPISHPYYMAAASKEIKGNIFAPIQSIDYANLYK